MDYIAMTQQDQTPTVFDDEPQGYNAPAGARMAAGASDMAGMMLAVQQIGACRAPMSRVVEEARRVGKSLASDAYYRFPMGGGTIEGPSIRLMEQLKSAWGYVWTETVVTDIRDGHAYIRAMAVDLITCNPHTEGVVYALSEAKKGFAKNEEQRARWESMQTRSAASKALRGALLRIIPTVVVREAMRAATEAKEPPRGHSLSEVLDVLVATFAKSKAGVTLAELEHVVSVPRARWTVAEWRVLDDLLRALMEGHTTVDEVWPSRKGPTAPVARPAIESRQGGPLDDAAPLPEGGVSAEEWDDVKLARESE